MFLLVLSACPGNQGAVEEPLYSGEWEAPTREMTQDLDLPQDDDGDYILITTPGASLVYDPDDRSPPAAAGECAALVMTCLAPERNVLGCLQNVTTCESDEPWKGSDPFCCHASCEDTYVALRQDGLEEADALAKALFGDNGCSPGFTGGGDR